jgi:hypothetical protein
MTAYKEKLEKDKNEIRLKLAQAMTGHVKDLQNLEKTIQLEG